MGTFSAKMVYKRTRGWTSGRSLPVLNSVKYFPPGPIYCKFDLYWAVIREPCPVSFNSSSNTT